MILPCGITTSCLDVGIPEDTAVNDVFVTDREVYVPNFFKDRVPDELDYGGRKVNILIKEDELYRREWAPYEEGNTVLSKEIYNRNRQLEKELGIILNFKPYEGTNEAMNCEIQTAGKNGSGEYDIISNRASHAASVDILPYYMDLNDKNSMTYLYLNKSHWNRSYIDSAECYGRLYTCVGIASFSVYDHTMAVFYNRAEAESRLGYSLYDRVLEDLWTYETFYNLVAELHDDMGTEDMSDDFYGLYGSGATAVDGFLYSMGTSPVEFYDDGTAGVTEGYKYKRLENVYLKTDALWQTKGAVLKEDDAFSDFLSGNTLFYTDVIYKSAEHNRLIREMEDGYGILPLPKYGTEQTYYASGVADNYNVMSVMHHWNQDFEMVSATLELLNDYSQSMVQPFYIEEIVKGENMYATSCSVFNLIIYGLRWNFSDIYGGDRVNAREVLWSIPLTDEETPRLEDVIADNKDQVNSEMKKIVDWLRNY